MSTPQDERELIFASFEDAAMGAVAEKALRELERQVESITLGNVAVVSRDADGELHVHQSGHLSARQGALFGLIAGGLVGAAIVGLPFGVAIGTAAGVQAAAVAAGSLASAAASASSTALAVQAAIATGLSAAASGGLGAALGSAAGSLASIFGFKDDDLKQVGEALSANRSAVIALITPQELPEVTEFLERLGATVQHGAVSQSLLDLALSQAPAEVAEGSGSQG
ncbi:MAG: hypothetical protein IT306_28780 [Chloroflexi bacterium]|nr:hypothetical protein [Chloroflexota bacterium]